MVRVVEIACGRRRPSVASGPSRSSAPAAAAFSMPKTRVDRGRSAVRLAPAAQRLRVPGGTEWVSGSARYRPVIALLVFAAATAIALLTGGQSSLASRAAAVRTPTTSSAARPPPLPRARQRARARRRRRRERPSDRPLRTPSPSSPPTARRTRSCATREPIGATTCTASRAARRRRSIPPPRARSTPPSGESLALVQFVGPIKDAWLARMRADRRHRGHLHGPERLPRLRRGGRRAPRSRRSAGRTTPCAR